MMDCLLLVEIQILNEKSIPRFIHFCHHHYFVTFPHVPATRQEERIENVC